MRCKYGYLSSNAPLANLNIWGRPMRTRGRAGWMALCAAISAACGRSGGPQGTAPAIVEVSIDPAAVAIAGGGSIRFIAAVTGTADAAVTGSTAEGIPPLLS